MASPLSVEPFSEQGDSVYSGSREMQARRREAGTPVQVAAAAGASCEDPASRTETSSVAASRAVQQRPDVMEMDATLTQLRADLAVAKAAPKKNREVIRYYKNLVTAVEKQQEMVQYMNAFRADKLANAVDLPKKGSAAAAAALEAANTEDEVADGGDNDNNINNRETAVTVGEAAPVAGGETSEAAREIAHEDDDDEGASFGVKFAIRASLAVNVLLLCIKLAAFIRSGSLVVLASFVDSALDLFSGLILIVTMQLVKKGDPLEYPIGKHNFEPIGVLVFSCCMCVAASQVLQEAIITMVDIESQSVTLEPLIFAAIGFVIVAKSILYFICRAYSEESDSCEALRDDHRNDVLTNSLGLGSLFVTYYWWPYADPLVAGIAAVYIMVNWARSSYERIMELNNRRASHDEANLITFVALHHHPDIQQVDTVRCFVTGGGGVIAEVDVVMDPACTLKQCHDVGESLQLLLERCPLLNVFRAYVHVDYETDHKPSDHR